MFYKTYEKRLTACGWKVKRRNSINPFTSIGAVWWVHPHDTPDEQRRREICIEYRPNKDGTPGRILTVWQGGRLCRI